MKKTNLQYLTVIILMILLISPQVSLAAWWNPFSWNIFNKNKRFNDQSTEIQQLKNRISELEQKSTSSSSVTKKTTATTTMQVKSQVVTTKIVSTTIQPTTTMTLIDSATKIARCKAESDSSLSILTSNINLMVDQKMQEFNVEANKYIADKYANCLATNNEYTANWTAGYREIQCLGSKEFNTSAMNQQANARRQELNIMKETFIAQGKAVADKTYYDCLSK